MIAFAVPDAAAGASPAAAPDAFAAPEAAVAGAPPAGALAIPGLPLDRPELHVGAAFAGGLLLATILRRLAR